MHKYKLIYDEKNKHTSKLLLVRREKAEVGLTTPNVTGSTTALAVLHSSCTAMCTTDWNTFLHLDITDALVL